MSQSSPAVLGPVESSVGPAIIREYGHPDVVRGDAVAVAPGQRIELVLWADMEAEVRRAVAAERERCAALCRNLHFKYGGGIGGLDCEAEIRKA